MNSLWLDDPLTYDGSQLRAHWILARTGRCGDAIVGWRGPCAVARAEIADLEDLDGPGIAADDMVHLLWEAFTAPDLLLAVHRQRLLTAQALELVRELAAGAVVQRRGDDLFFGPGKLTVSIATVSPVSSLIHFGVNAGSGGAPVAIASLQQLGIDPPAFGRRLLAAVVAEQAGIELARAKARVKGEWQR